MSARHRLLLGSLAVAAVLSVVIGIAISDTASEDPVDDEIVLDADSPLDQPQTLNTNAAVTGTPLPRVDVQTQDGEDLNTAMLIGRPLVVNIWYSGCLPCKKELPDFAEVHSELGEQVRFIGLDSLAPSDVERAFAEEHGVRYELLYDTNGSFLAEAGVTSQPVTLFVAADGTIVEQTGQIDAAELRAIITDQLL